MSGAGVSVGYASGSPPRLGRDRLVPILFALAGLAVLLGPMLFELGTKLWVDENNSYAGILMLCLGYAFWRDRSALPPAAGTSAFALGALLTVLGLIGFGFGRFADLVQFQGLSLPLIGAGLTLAIGGWALLRRWWLLVLLLAFVVPWIGPAADWLLVPLRLKLTHSAIALLSTLGIPVSGMGVLVNVGFVQLNVAGACVGLRSTISIIALGLLSLHFFPPRSIGAGLLFVALLPVIGLGANFLRVCLLIASAHWFGSNGAAGLHDIAAYLEVGLSITLFMLLSHALSAARSASPGPA